MIVKMVESHANAVILAKSIIKTTIMIKFKTEKPKILLFRKVIPISPNYNITIIPLV